jgi:predicted ATP-binding protein involved in virulence
MKIKKLKLKNYRGFERFEIKIPRGFAVILGDNASGKTAILEALCICLGTILVGFDGINSIGIKKDDVRQEYHPLGSSVDIQPRYPVNVVCEMFVDNQSFSFSRSINKPGGSTTRSDANEIISYFNDIDKAVKQGAEKIILPLISYYSTGRLWLHSSKRKKIIQNKNERKVKEKTSSYRFNRLNGYVDCLSAKANEKLMLKWFETMEYVMFQKKKNIPELDTVKSAIAKFFARSLEYDVDIQKIKIEFDAILNQLVLEYPDIDGEIVRLPFGLLSDGYKTMLSMVTDIAYRMATLNPQLFENALTETPGVVLIDEIDMHLHPKWQRHVVEDLRNIFPKIQFIMTTHSEHVITNVDQKNIIKLGSNGEILDVPYTKGRDLNSLTMEVMDLPVREQKAQALIYSFYRMIGDKKIDEAKKLLQQMIDQFGENDSEVIQALLEYHLEVE